VRQALAASDYDAVFIPREASLIGPALAERIAARRNPALIFDFDDAIWVPYVSPTNRFFSYLKMPWKTKTLCRIAAATIAGNDYLATFARRFSQQVSIVPSTVSLRTYRPAARTGSSVPIVGWTGSHSSVQYLESLTPALAALKSRRPFRLVVVGAEPVSLAGVETEWRPWKAESEVEDISDFDIGLMPLPDEPWARGKCALKAIQYMGVGVPAVVSPVGANADVVVDGRTGFHASATDEWIQAIEKLLDDEPLRARMGESAYRRVAERYSAESQAPRVAHILIDAARGRR